MGLGNGFIATRAVCGGVDVMMGECCCFYPRYVECGDYLWC